MNFREYMENQAAYVPLYFGTKNEAGHYAWDAHGNRISRFKSENPGANFLMQNDGKLAPKQSYKEGQAILHHYPEFAILAYWDNKVDSRPGSNSMFLIPGKTNPGHAIEVIKQNFPEIWHRSPAVVVGEMHHG